jgi:hypothetical protein
MRTYSIEPTFQEGCEDGDSLFGSPPPSPLARGRSPLPASAVSSGSSGASQKLGSGSMAQNVGTIALPGSHIHSELSINPIAASLSLPGSSCTPVLPLSLPSSEPHSRQSSVGCHETTPKTHLVPLSDPNSSSTTRRQPVPSRKRVLKRKVKEQTRPPPPPPIALPDPSQPPPAHFLRSQQALLGHAGLVAGVKPSQLAMNGTPRGASPSNPIVLDDREAETIEHPLIGRSHSNRIPSVDQSELPKPTYQEIVQIMFKQKDIFPVVQNILKLLTARALGGKPAAPTLMTSNQQFTKRAQNNRLFQPPPKRRKLNRVPAGAVDWDVPYPFREGEGPEAYQQTWLQDRGRQLVSQLINLVKTAAQKAAARKHMEELAKKKRGSPENAEDMNDEASQRQGGKGANHYREVNNSQSSLVPITQAAPRLEAAGKSPTSEYVDLVSAPGVESQTAESVNAMSSSASFNDLFSALLAAPDLNSMALVNPGCSSSDPSGPPELSSGINPSAAAPSVTDGHMEQCLIDSWMNILQTFPLQEAGAQGVSSPDQQSLEYLLGFNSSETPSSFASPISGDSPSFVTTPNLDNQSTQTFDSLNFDQLGGLDLALNLFPGGISPPESVGSDPSTSRSALPPSDFSFDRASSLRDPIQEPGRTNQTQLVTTGQSPSGSDSFADSLIDPQLLALSQHDFGALVPPSSNTAQNILAHSEGGVSPCSSLASSSSLCEPVTPSSAAWDMAPKPTVDGTFGMW